MARKKKEIDEVKTSTKSYKVVEAMNGTINKKAYSFKEGDIVELSRLEAFAFSSYIKEQ